MKYYKLLPYHKSSIIKQIMQWLIFIHQTKLFNTFEFISIISSFDITVLLHLFINAIGKDNNINKSH